MYCFFHIHFNVLRWRRCPDAIGTEVDKIHVMRNWPKLDMF
jgi:hypothetical protein